MAELKPNVTNLLRDQLLLVLMAECVNPRHTEYGQQCEWCDTLTDQLMAHATVYGERMRLEGERVAYRSAHEGTA